MAAGLSCAVEVAGAGFFGPLAGSSVAHGGVARPRSSGTAAAPGAPSRWLGSERRGARRGVAESLYEIRGGASGVCGSWVMIVDGLIIDPAFRHQVQVRCILLL